MRLQSWLRSLFFGSPKPPSASARRQRNSFRPGLERLEDRTVPAYLLWGSDAHVVEPDSGVGEAYAVFPLGFQLNGLPLVVDYYTMDNTAYATTDYVDTAGSLEVPADPDGTWETALAVPIVGDVIPEYDEAFALSVYYLLYYDPFTGESVYDQYWFTGTIHDNDPGPFLSITGASVTEGDAGTTNAIFTVSLSEPSATTVSVDFATYSGWWDAATPGLDCTPVSGTLRFAPGEVVQTIAVPVIGDLASEPNESFSVQLANPVNAGFVPGQEGATGTIVDDDTPSMSITDVSVTEGNVGTKSATFTVNLSFPAKQATTVAFATANDTAGAGVDYVATSGTLTFAAGQSSKTITVPVLGDRIGEPNESFLVNLSSPVGASIADGQGRGTIVDDEPRISINDVTKLEGRSGTTNFVFTVTLSFAYDVPVTVNFVTFSGTAASGEDFTAKSGTLTFNPGETTKTITIAVKGDKKKEGNETFFVDLSGAANALFTKKRGIGTILNDD